MEGFEQQLQVRARLRLEPVCKLPVQPQAGLAGEGLRRRVADEVVGEPEGSAAFQRDPAGDQLSRRRLGTLAWPILQPREVSDKQWPGCDGEQPDQTRCVTAEPAQSFAEEPARVWRSSSSTDQRFQPERRPGGTPPQLRSLVDV